jgi:16S rRNA (guanine527-N7)-methyltransferase
VVAAGAAPLGPGERDSTASRPVPEYAAAIFGAQLPLAVRYAELLCGPGIERGLLGPREPARIWDRHLVNCALVAQLIPPGARVVDVGSGAGLPGLVLALLRPDLRVDLVESLRRRVDFLNEAAASLSLGDRVRVVHGRAEERPTVAMVGGADWVSARALAPLDRLVRWCIPLLRPGGHVLALKGERVADEVVEHSEAVVRAGGGIPQVVRCEVPTDAIGKGLSVDHRAVVVLVERVAGAARSGRGRP